MQGLSLLLAVLKKLQILICVTWALDFIVIEADKKIIFKQGSISLKYLLKANT